jgi:sugar lactone lactonase YvrE
MVTDMVDPNGLAFSPDERVLYVSDTGWARDKSAPRHIRAYDVVAGACVSGRVFAEINEGWPDGFRVDEQGRVWSSSGDGVPVPDQDDDPQRPPPGVNHGPSRAVSTSRTISSGSRASVSTVIVATDA